MTVHSVLIQKLLSTNAQLGKRVTAHHFKIYTYGSRNAMTIIDSDKTLICLRNACNFIANLARQRARFLFVNTNVLCDEIIEQMTKKIGCANDTSWRLGGFLTNSGSPKKFRSRNKKLHLGAVRPPDCVVIMDTARKSSVIFEADKLQIPIVGLVDSSMPWEIYKRITYPIPANDSVKFVYLFCNLITKTFLVEQKKLASVSGPAVIEEVNTPQLSSKANETKEDSEYKKQIESGFADHKLVVLPYESLALPLDDPLETKKLLEKLLVLKFNGGVGMKMGFSGLKSSIQVHDERTTLDLIVNQIESLNSKHGCTIPLILMNTLRTHDDTLKVVDKYLEKNFDIHTLCQSQSHPVMKGQDSEDESYHFDHHELFLSLENSGTLDALLVQGKEFIFVANSDNLGATIDSKILNHLSQNGIEYCMEVLPTEGDAIGSLQGRFEQYSSSFKLLLLALENKIKDAELNLCDTGNFWVNLKAVKRLLETGLLNVEKRPLSKLFDRSIGVKVPNSRFRPMTTTSDLLLLQSDLYTNVDGVLIRNSGRTNPANPSIELGTEFEKLSDFKDRFKSIPSIINLDSLKVKGDVWFGNGITLKGKVSIAARPGVKLEIPDGVVLENKEITGPEDI